MRVSTATINQALRSNAMELQGEYNKALLQQSSGMVSQSLSGLNGGADTKINLDNQYARSKELVSDAEQAQLDIETAYATLSSITDLLSDAKTMVASTLSGVSNDASTLVASAASWMEDIADLLNTDLGGRYVFAGSGGSRPAVDLTAADYDPLADATQADGDYYVGKDASAAILVNEGETLEYGVTAADPAFEKALRAFAMLADMEAGAADEATIQAAYALLEEAETGIAQLQEKLSAQASRVEGFIADETSYQGILETALENLQSVDVAEAAARVSEYETLLQASYSALASVTGLSLTDYL